MYEGGITVTDGRGNVILSGNIWALLLVGVFTSRLPMDPQGMRVFIDGKEIVMPDVFEKKEGNGGDLNGD